MSRLLVKGARVVDPSQDLDGKGDVLIEDGVVAAVSAGEPLSGSGAEVIEAAGLVAVPGLIDMHVHLREPGDEYKETIATGAAAAAAGGFTAVAAMANTKPPNDSASVTEFVLRKAAAADKARVYPMGTITKGMKGKELAEMGEMVEAGAVAFSDDGLPVRDPAVMRRAMEYSRTFDVAIVEHCETPELSEDGVMFEGYWSTSLGLRGIPAASEVVSVSRNLHLARATGARLHVAHLSTADALAAVAEARDRGVRVTCEVTPHHLLLTDESLRTYDTNAKMKPPLASEDHRVALVEALAGGAVDCIATDHAPHHEDEKAEELDRAPFGVVGLETALALCLDRLVRPGVIDLKRLVELLSCAPARILGVAGGTLAVGAPADLTLIDLERTWHVDPARFVSKGRNTPFGGWELRGRAVRTIVEGRTVWSLDEGGPR